MNPQARVVTPWTKPQLFAQFHKRVRWKGYKNRLLLRPDRGNLGNAPIKME